MDIDYFVMMDDDEEAIATYKRWNGQFYTVRNEVKLDI